MSNSDLKTTFSEQAAQTTRPRRGRRKAPAPFSIRFTEEERERLERDAGTLSLAAYIRMKLLSGDDAAPAGRRNRSRRRHQPSAELTVLGHMLGGLGQSALAANMERIAKTADMGALPVTPELEHQLAEACADIARMRMALIEALGVKVR